MEEPVAGNAVPRSGELPPQGIGYILILYKSNPDGTTGDIVDGDDAKRIGERIGLGEPSDGEPLNLGIWYIEP